MIVLRLIGGAFAVALMLTVNVVMARDEVSFAQGQNQRLPAFTTLVVENGGEVTVRPSTSYSATVVQGGDKVELYTDNGELMIDCARPCRGDVRRVIEIFVPSLQAVEVRSGSIISFTGGFPGQNDLSLRIEGGGAIDAFALPANNVTATVRGGGTISTSADNTLNANIVGAGYIIYNGSPRVTESIKGSGSVAPR